MCDGVTVEPKDWKTMIFQILEKLTLKKYQIETAEVKISIKKPQLSSLSELLLRSGTCLTT